MRSSGGPSKPRDCKTNDTQPKPKLSQQNCQRPMPGYQGVEPSVPPLGLSEALRSMHERLLPAYNDSLQHEQRRLILLCMLTYQSYNSEVPNPFYQQARAQPAFLDGDVCPDAYQHPWMWNPPVDQHHEWNSAPYQAQDQYPLSFVDSAYQTGQSREELQSPHFVENSEPEVSENETATEEQLSMPDLKRQIFEKLGDLSSQMDSMSRIFSILKQHTLDLKLQADDARRLMTEAFQRLDRGD